MERSAGLVAAAEVLAAAAGEVTDLMVREVGKPVTEAAAKVGRRVGILRYYAQQILDPNGETYPGPGPAALLLSRRRPRGVAGLITPWNFPVAIPLWKAAPALAFGNGVVLKAASEATALAMRLAELLSPTLPDGLFQVVPGSAATATALIGQADCVSFTGSVEVGRQVAVAATARGIPCQAEMGGLNASIVLPDANPARGAVVEAAEVAAAAGGRVLAGGRAEDGEGWFVAPTLVDRLAPDAYLAQEEVVGPIAVVLPVADEDEAVAVANGVRYGLVGSVFTRDLDRALAVAARLDTGMIRVNAPTSGVDYLAPFGGEKDSSFGPREQ